MEYGRYKRDVSNNHRGRRGNGEYGEKKPRMNTDKRININTEVSETTEDTENTDGMKRKPDMNTDKKRLTTEDTKNTDEG